MIFCAHTQEGGGGGLVERHERVFEAKTHSPVEDTYRQFRSHSPVEDTHS